jgi:hypothetical protein
VQPRDHALGEGAGGAGDEDRFLAGVVGGGHGSVLGFSLLGEGIRKWDGSRAE